METKSINEVFNVNNSGLAQHVRDALKLASEKAGNQEISTAHCIQSVMQLARGAKSPSDAFTMISNIFSSLKMPEHIEVKYPNILPEESKFSHQLEKSFKIAWTFLSNTEIWGIDFVTLLVLTPPDPNIQTMLEESGLTLKNLRDKWFEFVSQGKRKDHRDWIEWWKAAGVPIPETKVSQENIHKPVNYWIFQTAVERFDLSQNIIQEKKDRWLANQNKNEIRKNDIVFFWQAGDRPGIYGWGLVESEKFYVFDKDSKDSVDVVYKLKLSQPVLINNIKKLSSMKDHQLLKPEPTPDTNIKITTKQAFDINELIKETPRPEIPDPGKEQSFVLKFQQISDLWTTDDQLGYEFYAHAISKSVLDKKLIPPITISIQAPWGQGKTSLMKMIEKKLDPNKESLKDGSQATFRDMYLWLEGKDISEKSDMLQCKKDDSKDHIKSLPTVWFNPLFYQNNDQVWAGLAHAMLDQLSERLERKEREKFWLMLQYRRLNVEAIKKDIRWFVFEKFVPFIVFYLLLTLAMVFLQPTLADMQDTLPDFLKLLLKVHPALIPPVVALLHWIGWDKIKVKSWSIQEKFEKYVSEPDYESKQGYLWLVDKDVNRALDLLVGNHPIAIFIDDLDRCSPNIVSEVIYAINQFISVSGRNIIFIIGMDTNMVAEALEKFHESESNSVLNDSTKSFGWQFVEKFIQVPFFIPRLSDDMSKNFLASFFGEPEKQEEEKKENVKLIKDADKKIEAVKSTEEMEGVINEVRNIPVDEETQKLMQKASDKLQQLLHDPESEEIKQLVDLAIQDLEYNPRSLKRYVNIIRLLKTVRTVSGKRNYSSANSGLLIVRASHLVINWPQIIGWLQGAKRVHSAGTWVEAYAKLNEITQNENSFKAWNSKVDLVWGDYKSIPLKNQSFYAFIKQKLTGDPNLKDIFDSGIF